MKLKWGIFHTAYTRRYTIDGQTCAWNQDRGDVVVCNENICFATGASNINQQSLAESIANYNGTPNVEDNDYFLEKEQPIDWFESYEMMANNLTNYRKSFVHKT